MYRKIKGLAYYKSHKLHGDNLPYLLRLGERAGHIFPVAQRALELLSSGVFQQKMEQVLEQVMTLLDFSDPQNPLLDRIRAGHSAALAKALAAGSKKLPKDPLVGFDQRSVDAQCRMAVNIQYANFPEEVAEIFQAQFPTIDVENGDLISGLKTIVMSVKPWIPKDEAGSFTDEISTDHPLFRPFIMTCLGQSIAK